MPINRIKVFEKCNRRCAYCGQPITLKNFQVDHFYPKNSSHLYRDMFGFHVDDERNLLPSCRKCNHYKRAHMPAYFKKEIQKVHEKLSKIYLVEVAQNFGLISCVPFDGLFYFEKIPDFVSPLSLTLNKYCNFSSHGKYTLCD